jgi:PPOX class probable F420-dependent enzyme
MVNERVVVDRPDMPGGYGPAEPGEGMLSWSWVAERLVRSRSYWVATTGPDGAPHVAPVWGVWVADAIWFGTDPASAKGRNLARDGRVVVHLESGDDAVIVHGDAVICSFAHEDPALVEAIDAAYSAKYSDVETGEPLTLTGGPEGSAVFRVAPRRVLAWREDDFVRSRTRWTFAD